MVKKPVAQNPPKSRSLIDFLVLLVIIVGIVLVVAELIINVLPEFRGKQFVSQANQAQGTRSLDKSFSGPTPGEALETNATK